MEVGNLLKIKTGDKIVEFKGFSNNLPSCFIGKDLDSENYRDDYCLDYFELYEGSVPDNPKEESVKEVVQDVSEETLIAILEEIADLSFESADGLDYVQMEVVAHIFHKYLKG